VSGNIDDFGEGNDMTLMSNDLHGLEINAETRNLEDTYIYGRMEAVDSERFFVK